MLWKWAKGHSHGISHLSQANGYPAQSGFLAHLTSTQGSADHCLLVVGRLCHVLSVFLEA